MVKINHASLPCLVKSFLTPAASAVPPDMIAALRKKLHAAISGELQLLTRSIDLDDPFDLSFEEKLFYNAKRLCVCFAVAALSISGLDLINIRPLEAAAEFANVHRNTRIAEWPGIIRSGIQQISFSVPASAVAAIPNR